MDYKRKEIIKNGSVDDLSKILTHADQYDLNDTLIFICEQGDISQRLEKINLLLNRDGIKADLSARLYGKAALHLAAERGLITLFKILVPSDEGPSILTSSGETALHCLFRRYKDFNIKNLKECVDTLINEINVDINIADKNGYTAIHLAALQNQWDCVETFLKDKKANIDILSTSATSARLEISQKNPDILDRNYPKRESEIIDLKTTLFNHIKKRNEEAFKTLLNENMTADNYTKFINCCNDGEFTILQASVKYNLVECTRFLIEKGADVNKVCSDLRKPVMMAVDFGFIEILSVLLNAPKLDLNAINTKFDLYTTLHFAVLSKNPNLKCIEMLLEKKSENQFNIDAQDSNLCTPLYYAVEKKLNAVTKLLLKYNANIFIKNEEGIPIFTMMEVEEVQDYFDSKITTEGSAVGKNPDYKLILDFGLLKQPPTSTNKPINELNKIEPEEASINVDHDDSLLPEMQSLKLMSQSPVHRPLLNHALIKTFLHFKWHRFFWFFYINFIFLTLFTISMNIFIINLVTTTGAKVNDTNKNEILQIEDDENFWFNFSKYFSICLWVYLVIRELIQIVISVSFWKYITQLVNLVEVTLIVLCSLLLFQPGNFYAYHSISAVTIILLFIELIFLIGRHPGLTTYFTMFYTVSKNFILFFLFYSFLIVAFALSFFVLFKHCESDECEENLFSTIGSSLFKTFIMLNGELEAGDIKFNAIYITSHIIFISFCFFMVIVLMNLLNGLAVSDIQVIKKEAEIICCESQVKIFYDLEQILFKDIINFKCIQKFCNCIFNWLKRHVLLLSGILPENKVKIRIYEWNRMDPDVRNICSRSCLDCNTGNLCCCKLQCLRNEHLKKSCGMLFGLENLLMELHEITLKHKQKIKLESSSSGDDTNNDVILRQYLQKFDFKITEMEKQLENILKTLNAKNI